MPCPTFSYWAELERKDWDAEVVRSVQFKRRLLDLPQLMNL